jgi:hypothetical protein
MEGWLLDAGIASEAMPLKPSEKPDRPDNRSIFSIEPGTA